MANPTNLPELYFVHVPKCGGTTFRQLMAKRFEVLEIRHPWETARLVKKIVGGERFAFTTNDMSPDSLTRLGVFTPETLEAMTSVVTVRDPFSRFLSLYRYHLATKVIGSEISVDGYIDLVEKVHVDFPSQGFHSPHGLRQTIQQVRWLQPATWRGPAVVIRLENFSREIRSSGLGLDWRNVAVQNIATLVTGDLPQLSQSQKTRLEILYQKDFELLGYEGLADSVAQPLLNPTSVL